jgi:hypothetical protein
VLNAENRGMQDSVVAWPQALPAYLDAVEAAKGGWKPRPSEAGKKAMRRKI